MALTYTSKINDAFSAGSTIGQVTASFTPAAGALVLARVSCGNASANPVFTAPTDSRGWTWTLVKYFFPSVTVTGFCASAIYAIIAPSATAGTLQFNVSSACINWLWDVDQISGTPLGNTVAQAVRVAATGDANAPSVGSPLVLSPTYTNANNGAYVSYLTSCGAGIGIITLPTGFTNIANDFWTSTAVVCFRDCYDLTSPSTSISSNIGGTAGGLYGVALEVGQITSSGGSGGGQSKGSKGGKGIGGSNQFGGPVCVITHDSQVSFGQ
jgi:hypothetical protein